MDSTHAKHCKGSITMLVGIHSPAPNTMHTEHVAASRGILSSRRACQIFVATPNLLDVVPKAEQKPTGASCMPLLNHCKRHGEITASEKKLSGGSLRVLAGGSACCGHTG